MYDYEISTNCSLRFWFSTLQLQLRQGSAEVCKSLTTFERQVTLISGGRGRPTKWRAEEWIAGGKLSLLIRRTTLGLENRAGLSQ